MKSISLGISLLALPGCEKTPPEPTPQKEQPAANAPSTPPPSTAPEETPAEPHTPPTATHSSGYTGTVTPSPDDPLHGKWSLEDATKGLAGSGALSATIDTEKG